MKPNQEITTLKQLKCMAHPLRSRILFLSTSKEPLSVQGIAHNLDLPHGKVYYHVRQLVENGFLEEVRTEPVNGIIERFYAPVAARFAISKELAGNPVVKRSLRETADRMFEQFIERMREDIRTLKGGRAFEAFEAFLTEEELHGIGEALDKLFEPFQNPHPGAVRTRMTALFAHEPFDGESRPNVKKEEDRIEQP